MNKTIKILFGILLVLVTVNLGLTIVMLQRPAVEAPAQCEAADSFDLEVAKSWGGKVTKLYNKQDHRSLYAMFNQRARVKISQQQLEAQLQKLHELFGDIEDYVYINSVKIGTQAGQQYHQLFYNVRVSGKNNPASMKLSVVIEDEVVSLYGLRLNASESLD